MGHSNSAIKLPDVQADVKIKLSLIFVTMEQATGPIIWKPDYELQIPSIDKQHQEFVRLLNQVYMAFMKMASKEEVLPILKSLSDYAIFHFQTEEHYFEITGYPGKEEHHLAHENLKRELTLRVENYKTGDAQALMDIFDFLENWLVQHLASEDIKYKDYLIAHGIS